VSLAWPLYFSIALNKTKNYRWDLILTDLLFLFLLCQDDRYGVVEDALAKDKCIEVDVDFGIVAEDCKDSDRIGS